jgi:hypothetical protein
LAAVAVIGLAVRVTYVLLEQRDIDFGGDARFYHDGANLLADGKGFISPFDHHKGHVVEAADHPPLYLVFLAIPSALKTSLIVLAAVAIDAAVVRVRSRGGAG